MTPSKTNNTQTTPAFNVFIPATILTLVLLVLITFKSLFWSFMICAIYIASALYSLQCLEYLNTVLTRLNAVDGIFVSKSKVGYACSVCNNDTCKRHKLLPHSMKVRVPKDFDTALEQLFEELLQTYVCTWYSDFSTNDAFVQQLRLAIATATKNTTIRLLRADVSSVIFNELVPLALQHASDWKALCKKARTSSKAPRDHVQGYLGCDIHPAAYSRKDELNYLRGLVTALVPHLLPAIHVSTNNQVILREILANWILMPAVDALADPENINALIALCTRRDGSLSDRTETVDVPMLQCWLTFPSISKMMRNNLKPSLDEVLNDPRLLYMFMQHVKEVGPMNLLQFCLDIDDLSKRMLNPEMSPESEELFYIDVQTMYATYLDIEGPEYLHLPRHISAGIQQILEGGWRKIQELRTSRPFYQAHQEAHALLEATCLPSFHHSYQLYDLLCGQLEPDRGKRSSSVASCGTSGNANQAAMRAGNHFSKIDQVFRTSTIEGSPFEIQEICPAEEVGCSSRTCSEMRGGLADARSRDLTSWRLSIPHVDGGDNQPIYTIAVHSVAEAKSWTVLRRDQDFYTLRMRLIEFHGDKELGDSPLPSRKSPYQSCLTCRQRYEEFLQKLISKPVLKSSELLYTFLTTPNLKPYLTTYNTPDIGILYQSVTYKLRKEKGQHLDKFLATFLASTNLKYDHADLGVELHTEEDLDADNESRANKIVSGIFGDNLALKNEPERTLDIPPKRTHIKGASLCLADAVDKLTEISPIVCQIFWIFASTLRERIDPFINMALRNRLTMLLTGNRAAIIVKLLHAKIMLESKPGVKKFTLPMGNSGHYLQSAREGLYGLRPRWLPSVYSPWNNLMDSILDSLQDGPLNKHLAYLLLDHILIHVFPELTP